MVVGETESRGRGLKTWRRRPAMRMVPGGIQYSHMAPHITFPASSTTIHQ